MRKASLPLALLLACLGAAMAADAGGATKACIEEGGACAASGGPACCTARRTGAPLKCVVAAGRRLCAGPPAVPAVPFARRRVEARMTGRGAQVQLWLSPPAAGTGLTTTFSVRLKEKIGNHYFKNGALYIVKVTKAGGTGPVDFTIEEGRGGVPAGALCSRSFSLELSLSNAAGSSAWVQYAGGHAVEMPPCRGSPPEAPAFSGVALEGGALVVKLQPLKPSVQGAGSAGIGSRLSYRVRGYNAATLRPAFDATWMPPSANSGAAPRLVVKTLLPGASYILVAWARNEALRVNGPAAEYSAPVQLRCWKEAGGSCQSNDDCCPAGRAPVCLKNATASLGTCSAPLADWSFGCSPGVPNSCATAGACKGVGGDRAACVPPGLPAWAQRLQDIKNVENPAIRQGLLNQHKAAVQRHNSRGDRLDMVWYGDSITGIMAAQMREPLAAAFPAPLETELFGVGGSVVEELAFRLMSGDERLRPDPRVIVLLIGINNLHVLQQRPEEPAARLHALLTWLAAEQPGSRVLVLAPLPAKGLAWQELGTQYRQVVAEHPGVFFSICGHDMDPSSPQLYMAGGLHPLPAGMQRVLTCVSPLVNRLIQRSQAAEGAAASQPLPASR